jgi:hypothetical protein
MLQTTEGSHITDYSETDGVDVVRLLDAGYEEVTQPELEIPLTSKEAMALRRALFGEGAGSRNTDSKTGWEDILNFVPDYVSNGSSGLGYRDVSQHLGVKNQAEAKEIWVQQWQNVLSSYTNEVWGDLGGLVEEARKEIQELRSDGLRAATPSEVKAVHRLRQILVHIRDGG